MHPDDVVYVDPDEEAYPDEDDDEEDDDERGFLDLLFAPADLASQAIEAIGGVFTNGQQTVEDIFVGGQTAVVALGTEAGDAIEHGQDSLVEVANPLNLLGLGAGLSAGGIAATSVVVVGGAALVDQLVAGGAGRMALFRAFRSR